MNIHLIYGPTASGKSALAVQRAREYQSEVINADATQLYADLQVLSARPTPAQMQEVPHSLYGMLSGHQVSSAGQWLERVKPEIERCAEQGVTPVLCGGTGLYFKALTEGLSPMPEIPAEILTQVEAMENAERLALLCAHDPAIAARLKPQDSQRLHRAVAVFLASGKPLSWWQAQPKQPIFPQAEYVWETLAPPRDVLYARCDARFLTMLQQGAVAEVEALLAQHYPPSAPVMKAVGVPEITAYLRGECMLEDATLLAQRNTRRYAKRQLTWLRNQCPIV